ncbi:MAG: hypothetical protein EOO90_13710 [Pedobacter sp.]|nr:MAG: hypothetical protein EOO90_13710 [Pedobacter sp.]
MGFKIDSQTYNDLNIFGGYENTSSIFKLFKGTKTLGGRELMEFMMRNPLNSISELNKRTDAIRFFLQKKLNLEIDHNQFDLILHYLNYEKGELRSNWVDSFIPWLGNQIKSNPNYYVVQVGIKFLLRLLKYAGEVVSVLAEDDVPKALCDIKDSIQNILETNRISYAYSLSSKEKLSFKQLGKIDSIIRRESRLVILELLHLFYQLDVFETLADVSDKNKFCLPTYDERDLALIKLKGLYHPSISAPVKNDLQIEEQNLMFLSGSNMAGKSSFLKALGLAGYLAHLGFPVPAASMQTSVFNGLVTTINLPDNIENGLSHYYSEVKRVKMIANMLIEQQKLFIILDELFKGTNSKDAYEASLLVINGFAEIPNSVFIISSHITTLASELKAKNISFNYLEHLMIDQEATFTYHLKNGVASDGIGMYFIEKENIQELLNRAKNN